MSIGPLNLCSDGHDEICYAGHGCPACSLKDDMQRKIADGAETIKQLNGEVSDLSNQVAELERQLREPLIPAVAQAREEQ